MPSTTGASQIGVSSEADRANERRASPRRVLLICPPFHDATLSSLSTARLATYLRQAGAECEEAYLHLDLVRIIGPERYRRATADTNGRLGEILFAEGIHGEASDADIQSGLARLFGSAEERMSIRDELARAAVDSVLAAEPELVGLTTSCYQLMAALWSASVIKQRLPATTIVLGGSACSAPMGQRILESYPDVDYVVSGFGEQPLLALSRGVDPPERFIENRDAVDIDALPVPDYSAFMRAAEVSEHDPRLALTFQTSLGCWWGQKHHCRFCGVNGQQMAFRAKSSGAALQEIRTLWDRYGRNLVATDAILSREHMKHVLPALACWKDGPKLFYEVKTNLTQAEVVALGRARMLLQLGVESLSTRLLGLLRKGSKAIQHLAVLKWCRERGVTVGWNMLCGIPGERAEDYEEQMALMAKIPQLPPPERARTVAIDRFSPYFREFRDFGWSDIEPFREYRFMHPHLDEAALRDIAYHFNGVGGVSSESYFQRFEQGVLDWQNRSRRGDGLFLDPTHGLVINEERGGRRVSTQGGVGRIMDCTHDIVPIARVQEQTGCDHSLLREMERLGLVFIEGNKVVNLAVRTRPPDPRER